MTLSQITSAQILKFCNAQTNAQTSRFTVLIKKISNSRSNISVIDNYKNIYVQWDWEQTQKAMKYSPYAIDFSEMNGRGFSYNLKLISILQFPISLTLDCQPSQATKPDMAFKK